MSRKEAVQGTMPLTEEDRELYLADIMQRFPQVTRIWRRGSIASARVVGRICQALHGERQLFYDDPSAHTEELTELTGIMVDGDVNVEDAVQTGDGGIRVRLTGVGGSVELRGVAERLFAQYQLDDIRRRAAVSVESTLDLYRQGRINDIFLRIVDAVGRYPLVSGSADLKNTAHAE